MKAGRVLMTLIVAVAAIPMTMAQTSSKASLRPQSAPPVPYMSVEAFGDEVLKSANLWRGYDFEALVRAARATRAPRGEFESSDEYSARIASAAGKPAYGSVSLGSRLALSMPEIIKASSSIGLGKLPFGYDFEPNAKTLRICMSGRSVTSAQLGRAVESVAVSKTTSTDSIRGNAYGVKVEVSSTRGEHITLAIRPSGIPVYTGLENLRCVLELEADGQRAQEILKRSGIVLFGKLRPPFIESDSLSATATISSPTEIQIAVTRLLFNPEEVLLVDRDTRAVIARAEIKPQQ